MAMNAEKSATTIMAKVPRMRLKMRFMASIPSLKFATESRPASRSSNHYLAGRE
jgi:hypothetical protein